MLLVLIGGALMIAGVADQMWPAAALGAFLAATGIFLDLS